ncbi:MAG: transposase [Candidatus Competibacteraceae bacterium]|nr:transposase [Candidatus Competibacteraceae bacterium]
MKRIRPLSEAECETLRAAWKDRPNGRVRQRAQAVYLAHRGYGRIALSALFEVGVDTISAWLDGWERAGLRGLYDESCAGRPPIYTPDEAARLGGWVDEEPSPRVNVLGFLSPTNQSQFHTLTGRATSALDAFAAQTAQTAQTAQAGKLRLVVLDNAPLHTSRAVQARVMDWFRQGVALHWLPPYSPELNLIEIRWRKIKYEWFPLRAYLSFDHLQSELQNILDQVGSKYKITFG